MAIYVASDDLSEESPVPVSRRYAWVVFALTFGLLISDYMSRQVLNAVFPLLKSEWALSDAQLGLLSGIVALMVGLLTFPLSLLADRWGRVRSLVLMAVLWSLATLACGLARSYDEMFIARLLVGVGEAAYGSVGIAVVVSVFPRRMRATLSAAFMAGGMFGSVLGMALGGTIAELFSWRHAFMAMAGFGLLLACLYPLVVKPSLIEPRRQLIIDAATAPARIMPSLRSLFASRSVRCAYVGSGLQLFVGGSFLAWTPSYLNRYFGMTADKAGAVAALIVLASGIGMIVCGMISDRLCRNCPERKISLAMAYCLLSALLLSLSFLLPVGTPQLLMIGAGMFLAAGTTGPAGAMVANLTPVLIHSTAFATLTLANNLLGLAPGPYLTGLLADHVGLQAAMQCVPLISVLAALVFFLARHSYRVDIAQMVPAQGQAAS